MSSMNEEGVKIVLNRSGPDQFWDEMERSFVKDDPRRWKYLAAFVLREVVHWPLERIALALDYDKGYLSRALHQVRADLRTRFRAPPDWKHTDPQRESNS